MSKSILYSVLAALAVIAGNSNCAAQLTVLHTFGSVPNDGAQPRGSGLVLDSGMLFGTTNAGGTGSGGVGGTIYEMSPDGSNYQILHNFSSSAGYYPDSNLVAEGNTLYGTTYNGSANGSVSGVGTIFEMNTDGTAFNTLYSFAYGTGDGNNPNGVIVSGTTIYGTTSSGGANGNGTVFKMNTDGSGYQTLYSFGSVPDGTSPVGSLVLSGGTLYGTTRSGGFGSDGSIFKLNVDGTGYSTLHLFVGGSADGAKPAAGLSLSADGTTLFGTDTKGGAAGNGTIFRINLDGSGYGVLHSLTTADGTNPSAELTVSGSILYGTAFSGGANGSGSLFQYDLSDSTFTVLDSLYSYTDGSQPDAKLTLDGNALFGTAAFGSGFGSDNANGTVFSYALSPAPEPNCSALVAFGLGLFAFRRRSSR